MNRNIFKAIIRRIINELMTDAEKHAFFDHVLTTPNVPYKSSEMTVNTACSGTDAVIWVEQCIFEVADELAST